MHYVLSKFVIHMLFPVSAAEQNYLVNEQFSKSYNINFILFTWNRHRIIFKSTSHIVWLTFVCRDSHPYLFHQVYLLSETFAVYVIPSLPILPICWYVFMGSSVYNILPVPGITSIYLVISLESRIFVFMGTWWNEHLTISFYMILTLSSLQRHFPTI